MKVKMVYRVTERYFDSGKTTATIEVVEAGTRITEGQFENYDQYQRDFTTLAAAKKDVEATKNA